jgi:hypothetical protein
MAEIQQKQEDSRLDAMNRNKDRESRERLAAIRLAEQISSNPGGFQQAEQSPAVKQLISGTDNEG